MSLYDPGLQPERTVLAWRRTVLALAVGAAVGARLLDPHIGPVAYVAALVVIVVALWAYVSVDRAYRRTARRLSRGEIAAVSPGPAVALVAVAVVALAMLALVLLASRWW